MVMFDDPNKLKSCWWGPFVILSFHITQQLLPIYLTNTAWKVSVFGVFLVRTFPHSDWIRRDSLYLSVFSPNAGKGGPKKLWIRTLFTQWKFSLGLRKKRCQASEQIKYLNFLCQKSKRWKPLTNQIVNLFSSFVHQKYKHLSNEYQLSKLGRYQLYLYLCTVNPPINALPF